MGNPYGYNDQAGQSQQQHQHQHMHEQHGGTAHGGHSHPTYSLESYQGAGGAGPQHMQGSNADLVPRSLGSPAVRFGGPSSSSMQHSLSAHSEQSMHASEGAA